MSVARYSRALGSAARTARAPPASTSARAFSAAPVLRKDKTPLSFEPTPLTTAPQFPAPADPFNPSKSKPESAAKYSEGTKNLVRGVAKLMGYNSAASTAIRETGRMMRGIVDAVEKERGFWYEKCRLPATYQTFFQLHLLYVLILAVRLRALRASKADASPVPEPMDPSAPRDPPSHQHAPAPGITLAKPGYETYPTELLSHFFELAESQMRIVLGRGERERVIRKYMEEMGEQWKGAGAGLDYVLGLGISEDPSEYTRSDSELASWAWRNLFASRGLTDPNPPLAAPIDEMEFIEELEKVVRFVRRELSRLDAISDQDVLDGNIGEWGRVDQ